MVLCLQRHAPTEQERNEKHSPERRALSENCFRETPQVMRRILCLCVATKPCSAFLIPSVAARWQTGLQAVSPDFYTAPALSSMTDGPDIPPLPVVCTSNPKRIESWLSENVNKMSVLGFDAETTAKTPWYPDRRNLPDGPACIQLSTVDSCLIVHLAQCGDASAKYAPEIVKDVLQDRSIIKAGIGIDDDALEVFRWSNKWQIRSRLDLCAVAGGDVHKRMGLRQVAGIVANVDLPKSKKIAMSNWSTARLSPAQVSYAARDAWAAAAVVHTLQRKREDVFGVEALLGSRLSSERDMADMDERARKRREAKLEFKAIKEEEKVFSVSGAIVLPQIKENTKKRKEQLTGRMNEFRPDLPPYFNSTELGLPW